MENADSLSHGSNNSEVRIGWLYLIGIVIVCSVLFQIFLYPFIEAGNPEKIVELALELDRGQRIQSLNEVNLRDSQETPGFGWGTAMATYDNTTTEEIVFQYAIWNRWERGVINYTQRIREAVAGNLDVTQERVTNVSLDLPLDEISFIHEARGTTRVDSGVDGPFDYEFVYHIETRFDRNRLVLVGDLVDMQNRGVDQ